MSLARSVARRIKGGIQRRADRVLRRLSGETVPGPATPTPPSPEPAPRPQPAPAPAPAPVEDDDVVGEALFTFEQVEELLEDMVRPALQSDGGDITLVRIDAGDIYVQLQGACQTCPSATATMRMGIERLLEEELPGFRSLIEVNGVGH
jgi:Fe-S cluster biogenesis protein NfuA